MSFVSEHRDRFGVEPILRVLDIPTSTYYDWVDQQRRPSRHTVDDRVLLGKIEVVHGRSGGTAESARPVAPRPGYGWAASGWSG
jgi:putative transposase